MPKGLSKVQKHIAKKKGKNVVLHENSRDSQRLQRAFARDDKLARLLSSREKQNQPLLQRISYIQDAINGRIEPFTLSEIQTLIQDFLHRDDEELAKLKSERRPGRPPSTKEDLIKQKQSSESIEYISGFWIPDLEDQNNLVMLVDWDLTWLKLNTLNFVRISKEGVKRPSTFPPRGNS